MPGPASSAKKIEAVAIKKNLLSEHLESKITDMMKLLKIPSSCM